MRQLTLQYLPEGKGKYQETYELVIHSLFACLVYYVEVEQRGEKEYQKRVNWLKEEHFRNENFACPGYRFDQLMLGLYRWWKKYGDRLVDESKYFKYPEEYPNGNPSHWEEVTTRHAKKIAKHMEGLWT